MMTTIQTYVRRGRRKARQWALDPRIHALLHSAFWSGSGFLLSAASLAGRPMPVALGLLCALEGWPAVLLGLGGALGYLVFWGSPGVQGAAWMASGVAAALLVGSRSVARNTRMLMPSLGCFLVSAWGVVFQIWLGDTTPVPVFLLRVALGGGCTWVFRLCLAREEPVADWITGGLAVLALAQVRPVKWLGLGYLAAGFLGAVGTLPGAALAGLGLDLAGITKVPMTAVLCLTHLLRLLPVNYRKIGLPLSAGVYLLVMSLVGSRDLLPLPGLVLGWVVGMAVPGFAPARRRGETGVAQVRLEMAAGVMDQVEQLLQEGQELPVDEQSLVLRAAERACGSCPCRKNCHDTAAVRSFSSGILHRPLLSPEDLPMRCRKPGRVLTELQRCQTELRQLRGLRERLGEQRRAVIQQYRFLSEYLRDLSDQLSQRLPKPETKYEPEIGWASAAKDQAEGDRCLWFSGVGGEYYVVLCDGMGTGLGAAMESREAIRMLRRLLGAGFPPEYALRSLNSLCALRGRAGAVTVDLAQLRLDTGKAVLYKWGGAPSLLFGSASAEKIGTAGPPPGLSVTDGRETVERLSLRRGETLVLVSDGVDGEETRRRCLESLDLPPGELAAQILEPGGDGEDDATAVVIRLVPRGSVT